MKVIFSCLLIALFATFTSSMVPTTVIVFVPGSLDCVQGCRFVAGGWPFAYLIDHPGISPRGSVSLIEGLLGVDLIWKREFLLSFLFWLAILIAVVYVLRQWRKRTRR